MDEQLRLLRQQVLAGDESACARYVRSRLRQGDLDWRNIELGGYLGDRVAQVFLGDEALAFKPRGGAIFFRRLPLPDAEVAARICQRLTELYAGTASWEEAPTPEQVLRAVGAARAFATDPDDAARKAAEDVLTTLALTDEQRRVGGPGEHPRSETITTLTQTLGLQLAGESDLAEWRHVIWRISLAAGAPKKDALIAGLREDLVPWLYCRSAPDAAVEPVPASITWIARVDGAPPAFAALAAGHAAEHAEARDRGRAARLDGSVPAEERYFTPGTMLPEQAAAVLAVALKKKSKPNLKESKAIIQAAYEARGWTPYRNGVVSPGKKRRVRFKRFVLMREEGGRGKWDEPASTYGQKPLITEIAKEILNEARTLAG